MQSRILIVVLLLFAGLGWTGTANAECKIGAPGQTVRVDVPGTGRTVPLHIPAGSAGGSVPLVFLFHGSGGTGAGAILMSRLAETADRHGFILVSPDGGIKVGPGFVWNIPGVPAAGGRMPQPDDADDVAFVTNTIDWLVAAGCVDRTRVYATGISGGGRMSSWLGCVAADRFAAIAPVVGLRAGDPLPNDPQKPDPATCRPSRPMPVIAFAGDADTTNPIAGGGAPYWQYPMAAAEARWAELNRCRAALPASEPTPGVREEGYTKCRGKADMVARITIGGRHVWLADNEKMWAFLSRYRRR